MTKENEDYVVRTKFAGKAAITPEDIREAEEKAKEELAANKPAGDLRRGERNILTKMEREKEAAEVARNPIVRIDSIVPRNPIVSFIRFLQR